LVAEGIARHRNVDGRFVFDKSLELTKTLIEASFAQLIKREFRTSFAKFSI